MKEGNNLASVTPVDAAVLAEAGFHLEDSGLVLALVRDGLVKPTFDLLAELPRLAQLAEQEERLGGPATAPAQPMNARFSEARAFSSWSRMILPWDNPLLLATLASHSASSGVRRIVIV